MYFSSIEQGKWVIIEVVSQGLLVVGCSGPDQLTQATVSLCSQPPIREALSKEFLNIRFDNLSLTETVPGICNVCFHPKEKEKEGVCIRISKAEIVEMLRAVTSHFREIITMPREG